MGRRHGSRYYSYWPAYVPVAERKAQAKKEAKKMEKSGRKLSPVNIEGRTIAKSFWGDRWCTRIERMADCDTRLTKGRTYARNGSIIDLQITEGKATALVMGSELYRINITIKPIPAEQWEILLKACLGKIDSIIELMQGRLSDGVMQVLTQSKGSLLPTHDEIKFTCSCPDYYDMCKHTAACLYGIGHRLDQDPLLLFKLRQVDPNALIKSATTPFLVPAASSDFAESELSSLFDIEIDEQRSQEIAKKQPSPQEIPKKQPSQVISRKISTQKTPRMHKTNKTAKKGLMKESLKEYMDSIKAAAAQAKAAAAQAKAAAAQLKAAAATETAEEADAQASPIVQAPKKRGRPKKAQEEETALPQAILPQSAPSPVKTEVILVEEKPALAPSSPPSPIDSSPKLMFPPFHDVTPPASSKPQMTAAEREQLRAEQDRRFQAILARGTSTQKKRLGRPRKTLFAKGN